MLGRSNKWPDDDEAAAMTAAAEEVLGDRAPVANLAEWSTATGVELAEPDPDAAAALLTATVAAWVAENGSTGDAPRDARRCLVDLASAYLAERDERDESRRSRLVMFLSVCALSLGLGGCADQWTVSYGPGPVAPCLHAAPVVGAPLDPIPAPPAARGLPAAPKPPAVGEVRPSRLATRVEGGLRAEDLLR